MFKGKRTPNNFGLEKHGTCNFVNNLSRARLVLTQSALNIYNSPVGLGSDAFQYFVPKTINLSALPLSTLGYHHTCLSMQKLSLLEHEVQALELDDCTQTELCF